MSSTAAARTPGPYWLRDLTHFLREMNATFATAKPSELNYGREVARRGQGKPLVISRGSSDACDSGLLHDGRMDSQPAALALRTRHNSLPGHPNALYLATRSLFQEALLFPAVHALCRPRVVGAGILQDLDGPFLLVANHTSHLDSPVLLRTLRRELRQRTRVVAAADYFYRTRLRGAMVTWALGAMPFDRKNNVASCLDTCSGVLASGGALLMFPEGTRSRDGRLAPFKRGAAHLAISTHVPVIPIGVRGLHAVLPVGASLPHPRRVNVFVGEPLWPLPGERAAQLTVRMEDAIAKLCGVKSNAPGDRGEPPARH